MTPEISSLTNISPLRRRLLLGYLAAAAIVAHVLESALPGLGPFFKVGLANTFTLLAYFQLSLRAATAVSLIRVFAGSLFLGTFLSPTFFLSLSGALGAVAAIGAFGALPVRLGPVGLSLLAALSHMTAQVVMAWLLIIQHPGIFQLLPWLLLGSWAAGVLNGLIAKMILDHFQKLKPILEN